MTKDISGFSTVVTIFASKTFPAGLPITQFADDSDPADFASISIAETAMGLNGDMVTFSKANPLPASISVIAGSENDVALGILAEANRVGQGKTSARDIITMNILYPDGSTRTLSQGVITDATFGKSISSAGRLKSKTYSFKFQNQVGA